MRMYFLVAATSILVGCVTSPLGRSQLKLFSDAEMRAMGEAAFTTLRRDQPIDSSPVVNAYVRCVASALTGVSANPDVAWEVVVFESDDVNAFALPGGKIGVYTGLLGVAVTQDQLAAVIGHEIGHVTAGHANERLSASTLTDVGMQVAGMIAGSPSPQRDTALAALGLGVQVGVLLPFSRTQEEEADLLGLDLMARAGFDPRESIALWQNMEKQEKNAPPEFLSTHPSSEGRIRSLQNRMPIALALHDQAIAAGRRPDCERDKPVAATGH